MPIRGALFVFLRFITILLPLVFPRKSPGGYLSIPLCVLPVVCSQVEAGYVDAVLERQIFSISVHCAEYN